MHESIRRHTRRPVVWVFVGVIIVAAITASTLRFVTAACAAAPMPGFTLPGASEGGQAPVAGDSAAGGQPEAGGLASAIPALAEPVQGRAYFYNRGGGQGTCSLGRLPAQGYYVSLAAPQYASASACGSYLDLTGPAGRVRAEVVDLCPLCTDGGLTMTEATFARIADPSAGTAVVTYRLVRDPRVPGRLELRMSQAATAKWLSFAVTNHGNPLTSVEIAPASGSPHGARWQSLVLSPDNYWVAGTGAGAGPFKVRITDVFGHQVVLTGIKLRPGVVQHSHVYMYAPGTSGQPAVFAPVPQPAITLSPAAHRTSTRPSAGTGSHC